MAKSRLNRGTWSNLEFRISKAREAITLAGTEKLPTKKELDELGYSTLRYAIEKYDHGFPSFRAKLGEDDINKEFRKYDDISYGLEIARKIKQEQSLATLPCDNLLRKLGYKTLADRISKKYGGYAKFRELLGETLREREKGKLKDLDYVLSQIKELMDNHRVYIFPTKEKLSKLDSSLAFACVRYFGYRVVRNRFNSRYTWGNEQILEKAHEFMRSHPEYKTFPDIEKLREDGEIDLARQIIISGKSIEEFRSGIIG